MCTGRGAASSSATPPPFLLFTSLSYVSLHVSQLGSRVFPEGRTLAWGCVSKRRQACKTHTGFLHFPFQSWLFQLGLLKPSSPYWRFFLQNRNSDYTDPLHCCCFLVQLLVLQNFLRPPLVLRLCAFQCFVL